MKKNILFILFAVLLIVFMFQASATISVNTELETNVVCPSSTILIEEQITSTVSDSFTISLSGSAATFSTAVPSGFYIEGGQTKSVFIYITPSTRIAPGTYNLEILISGSSDSKRITHEIVVENCHRTELTVDPSSDKICACEGTNVELTLMNKGSYLEYYRLSVEGAGSSWVTLSGTSFTLAKDSSVNIGAQINAPCDVSGDYDILFKVRSDSRHAEATASFDFEVAACYDYILNTDNYKELCEDERITLPIGIKNLGTADNSYDINLDAPSWVSLDKRNIRVESEEEEFFNLIINPPFGTEGDFSANVETLSERGKVLREEDISLKVSSCYGVSVELEKEMDKICNGLTNTYPVTIRNTGKFENTFDIQLTAPEWVSLSETEVTLEAGKEQEIQLTVAPGQDERSADYAIIVKAKDPTTELEDDTKLTLTTISVGDCYKPELTTEESVFEINRDSSGTIQFNLENKGEKTAEYIIELSGTAASFSQINPGTLTLESGKAETLYVYLAPSIETTVDNYDLTVTARLKDSTIVSSSTIQVKVLKEIEGPEITPEGEEEEEPDITGDTITEEEKPKKKGFFEAIADFFASLFRSRAVEDVEKEGGNKEPKLLKEIPDIELETGEEMTIDLSEYFEDPEGEDLFFTTIKPLNIGIKISGNELTITAPIDFEGERDMTIYTSDGDNIVPSNRIKITIIEGEETLEEEEEEPEEEVETEETEEEAEAEEEESEEEIEETPDITGDTIEETGPKISFFKAYQGYIIGAIVIIIIIIILMSGLGKKIFSFFEEEVEEKPKNNKK
ncbi:MAG: hypothetical protein JSW08_00315 [archaeon]|nr:MAG: hypothetical protein JSW08_00315 [archaeon]